MTTGALFLDVTPASALVFIDTAYVGSVADLQTRGVTLSAGRHWVDLEAPNYDRDHRGRGPRGRAAPLPVRHDTRATRGGGR